MLLLLGGLFVVVVVVALLGVQSLERPGTGISRSDAIKVAWSTRAPVRSPSTPPTWHLLCSGHTTDGSCDPTSQWVAIDYYTGEWIASEFSYPAGP